MWKKVVLGLLGLCVIAAVGLTLWVRSVLASDAVQVALAQQISTAIGQPVTIGGVGASVYPRVTVALRDVAIGDGGQIQVKTLDVGTDFRALLSRRIEHATLRLDGARVQLPLPPLTLGSAAPAEAAPAEAPVQLVSIDSVILSEVTILSGGRTITGNIDVVPQGEGLLIKHIGLSADDMQLTATGTITDLAGPVGDVAVKAGALNVDRLIAFFNDFSGGLAGGAAPAAPAVATPPPAVAGGTPLPGRMNLTVSLGAERATMGGLTIDAMTGTARATNREVALEPLRFGLFNGTYDGALSVALDTPQPTFRWRARVAGLNVAAATAYAGSPNTISGTLNGSVDLSGSGADAAGAMKSIAGTVQMEVLNGSVKNLGIIRAVSAATALSLDGLKKAQAGSSNTDEPFTRIGATVTLANGTATTSDLRFDALDLALQAAGTARLDASAMDLRGRLQLSEALSAQMNQTVVRLSQDRGRITLPAVISGSLAAPSVRVDAGDVAKRALRNTINDQAPKLIDRGIRGLMRK